MKLHVTHDFKGNRIMEVDRNAGAPWMTVELKTIHGHDLKDDDHESGRDDQLVTDSEIQTLLAEYEYDQTEAKTEIKKRALEFFTRKLELAGWMPKGLYTDGVDYEREKEFRPSVCFHTQMDNCINTEHIKGPWQEY